MSQKNQFVDANAPPPYKSEAARTEMTPNPLPAAISYHPQPRYQPTPTRALQEPGIRSAHTSSPYAYTVIECQPAFVQSQQVAHLNMPHNITGPHVPDKMNCSILSMICGCFLLGLAAVILASQANSLRTIDPHKALSKAKAARTLNIASFVIESVMAAIFLVLYVAVWSKNMSSYTD